MNDGSTSLRKFFSNVIIDEATLNAFLNTREIAYRNGRVITNKNIEVFSMSICFLICSLHWQAYKDSSPLFEGVCFVYIFDGFFDTWFFDTGKNGEYAFFNCILHEKLETLNIVRNTPTGATWDRVREDVYPE